MPPTNPPVSIHESLALDVMSDERWRDPADWHDLSIIIDDMLPYVTYVAKARIRRIVAAKIGLTNPANPDLESKRCPDA